MEPEQIVIRGAREHNLKNITVEIPKKKLIVLTGVSGSGKSSLAFDTLFAEGQRRYVESLSAYARQFLGQLDKPLYDTISGLSPTIAIEQKSASNNPRSTVGTITEIYDYLRVLYARVGVQHCYQCGDRVTPQSAQQIVDELASLPERTKLVLMAPVAENRKGEHLELLDHLRKAGFSRVMVNGETLSLADPITLDKKRKHTIRVVVDRIVIKDGVRERLTDSVETALREGQGVLIAQIVDGEERLFSEHNACLRCGLSFPALSPQLFSFNSPLGMCKSCNGLGSQMNVSESAIVPNPQLSLRQGAIEPWSRRMEDQTSVTAESLFALCEALQIDIDTPFEQLSELNRQQILYGHAKPIRMKRRHGAGTYQMTYEGICNTIRRLYHETQSDFMRRHYGRYFQDDRCPECEGTRLRPEARAVRVGAASIEALTGQTIGHLSEHFEALDLTGNQAIIAAELSKEIRSRLRFLVDVGLDYLTLHRAGPSLSGGESQRIRLASQLGSELGVVYVLDEPSIGLHQRDNRRLIATLERLRDNGNTVVVVEHDEETIEHADHVLDFGPGAGRNGGHVVYAGAVAGLRVDERSLTGRYLSGALEIEVPGARRQPNGYLSIRGARENNLKSIDVEVPLGVMVVFTGVSGAGKSSLVRNILYPAVANHLDRGETRHRTGEFDSIDGLEQLKRVINIDQKPIGRTPRSNPATYTKVFDHIRGVFAQTPEARAFGYQPGRFSFNVKGGRCENCAGEGLIQIEMHFLADVYVPCEVCRGHRYNDATLKVRFKGKNISDVLEMTVDEVAELFVNHPAITRILGTLQDVGLGYIPLGQSSTTLSGGEAQRIKLSRELAKRSNGDTLYILDEPTTGLHFEDVRKLLDVLQRFVDVGNTVALIEHNLDVIKCADFVIDLGPEGGDRGGELIAEGTPEELAKDPRSYTGRYLAPILAAARARRRKSR